MIDDDINRPLLDRATQSQFEPGSTVKPMVGIGAITQGILAVNEGIECTGYLVINGRAQKNGRCWTASKYGALGPEKVMHHKIPDQDPHVGHDGNPDGFLTYCDALQRSCNVFFETVADRLQMEGLAYWFGRFGLGRPTGIGIAETIGHVPGEAGEMGNGRIQRAFVTWASGRGKVDVLD